MDEPGMVEPYDQAEFTSSYSTLEKTQLPPNMCIILIGYGTDKERKYFHKEAADIQTKYPQNGTATLFGELDDLVRYQDKNVDLYLIGHGTEDGTFQLGEREHKSLHEILAYLIPTIEDAVDLSRDVYLHCCHSERLTLKFAESDLLHKEEDEGYQKAILNVASYMPLKRTLDKYRDQVNDSHDPVVHHFYSLLQGAFDSLDEINNPVAKTIEGPDCRPSSKPKQLHDLNYISEPRHWERISWVSSEEPVLSDLAKKLWEEIQTSVSSLSGNNRLRCDKWTVFFHYRGLCEIPLAHSPEAVLAVRARSKKFPTTKPEDSLAPEALDFPRLCLFDVGQGDCSVLYLPIGVSGRKKIFTILVDTGYANCTKLWNKYVASGVDLMVITHGDQDHISGAAAAASDAIAANTKTTTTTTTAPTATAATSAAGQDSKNALPFPVKEIWIPNTLPAKDEVTLTRARYDLYESVTTAFQPKFTVQRGTRATLSGAKDTPPTSPRVEILVLHPSDELLTKLQESLRAPEEKKYGLDAPAAKEGITLANRAGIVFAVLWQLEDHKRSFLFTGDARSDDIAEGLVFWKQRLSDWFGGEPPYAFDYMDLPHHGSSSANPSKLSKMVKPKMVGWSSGFQHDTMRDGVVLDAIAKDKSTPVYVTQKQPSDGTSVKEKRMFLMAKFLGSHYELLWLNNSSIGWQLHFDEPQSQQIAQPGV